MTPDDLAKSGTEHAKQRALFAWANCAALYGVVYADEPLAYDHRTRDSLRHALGLPQPVPCLAYLFAIHNQGHGDAIRGARAKAEGVKAGVPDLMLPVVIDGYAGLFIEMKKTRKTDTSAVQVRWLNYLNQAGYVTRVAVDWREARQCIVDYLWPILPTPNVIAA